MKQSAFYQVATKPSEAVAITTGDAGPRQSAARDRLHCWRVQAADHARLRDGGQCLAAAVSRPPRKGQGRTPTRGTRGNSAQ